MSHKIYIAKDQETVFDIAVKLYKDARGISDVLMLNPSLDLEAVTYFGQEITYDDAVRYTKEVFVIPVPEPARPKWLVRTHQNIYDLVIQVYGDLSNLGKILAQFPDLADPNPGTEVVTEFTDNILANALFSQKIVATSEQFAAPDNAGGIGVMIIESTFIVG